MLAAIGERVSASYRRAGHYQLVSNPAFRPVLLWKASDAMSDSKPTRLDRNSSASRLERAGNDRRPPCPTLQRSSSLRRFDSVEFQRAARAEVFFLWRNLRVDSAHAAEFESSMARCRTHHPSAHLHAKSKQ